MPHPHPYGALSELSLRKSPTRARLLILVCSLGEAYTGELARGCGVERKVVAWAMLGHPPKYSAERSLVALGLVELVMIGKTRVWRVTDKGRRKARSLTSRDPRRRRQILS